MSFAGVNHWFNRECHTRLKASDLPKAYDLLASQPITAAGLSAEERDLIVISAVADAQGNEHVLSRFGDTSWDLWPFYQQSNVSDCQKVVDWPEDNHGIHCPYVVRFGRPAAKIGSRADEIAADLVVIGAHGRNFCSDLFLAIPWTS